MTLSRTPRSGSEALIHPAANDADLCPSRLFAVSKRFIQRATDHAGIGFFGIADDAGFVDFFAGEANVGGCSSVPDWNGGVSSTIGADNFAPFLRRVIFIGHATLGAGFDLHCVCLGAVSSTHQLIVSFLGRRAWPRSCRQPEHYCLCLTHGLIA